MNVFIVYMCVLLDVFEMIKEPKWRKAATSLITAVDED